jgi:DNA polymerase-3 subunit alpha
VFPKVYDRSAHLLTSQEPILVQGTVQKEEDRTKIFASELRLVSQVYDEVVDRVNIRLKKESINESRLAAFKKIVDECKGAAPVFLTVEDSRTQMDIEVSSERSVKISDDLIGQLEEIFPGSQLAFSLKEPVVRPPQTDSKVI